MKTVLASVGEERCPLKWLVLRPGMEVFLATAVKMLNCGRGVSHAATVLAWSAALRARVDKWRTQRLAKARTCGVLSIAV